MNNKTINNKLITLLFTLLAFTNVMSQSVDSSFTYQGELLDNGSPANGQYDINLDLIDGDMNPWGDTSEHSPVEVVNGLFSVNADFNIDGYDGYKDVTVTVSIRKTSEGPGGAFTVLGSQTIQAVPLATNLTNGGATSGQVLTFNGFQWDPSDPAATSPWNTAGSSVSYSAGTVNIGSQATGFSSSGLNVGTSNDRSASFNGGDRMYVFFQENGVGRGYVGSFQSPNPGLGINDNDFEIGTVGGSTGNLHLVTGNNEPAVTIDSSGTTKFNGDTKQELESNGMVKFMVNASCSGSPSILKSYNGVANSTGNVSIEIGSGGGSCELTFPEVVNDRYWQVSPVYASSNAVPGARGATCRSVTGSPNKLRCETFETDTGSLISATIMIHVY